MAGMPAFHVCVKLDVSVKRSQSYQGSLVCSSALTGATRQAIEHRQHQRPISRGRLSAAMVSPNAAGLQIDMLCLPLQVMS